MPPRKRTSSGSSKKSSNQNNQPQQSQLSKYGIQHFFERHSQNASQLNPKKVVAEARPEFPSYPAVRNLIDSVEPRADIKGSIAAACARENANSSSKIDSASDVVFTNNNSSTKSTSTFVASRDVGNLRSIDMDYDVSVSRDPKKGSALNASPANDACSVRVDTRGGLNSEDSDLINLKTAANFQGNELRNPSQSSPTDVLLPVEVGDEENCSEITPEVCKSVPFKRFKFSPGMLIKQSQDDGGEDVTWRISPVNERLHAMSKHFAGTIKVLSESSRFNSLNFQQCSQKKSSSRVTGKVERWLSSPPPPSRTGENPLACSNGGSLKNFCLDRGMDIRRSCGNTRSKSSSDVINSQSPFKTPPSLTYCHDKPADCVVSSEVFEQLGSKLHKKALIDLLDQVEDVISVDESVYKDIEPNTGYDGVIKAAPLSKVAINSIAETHEHASDIYFLVLEVSENHGHLNLTGSQCSSKVLRLLNEQSGEERTVELLDEWFYSVVAPGDTVHIIGEFNRDGKCDVNREKNFLIVHPDILVSGTRVASSFTCPRRAVLDERLKSGEHSAAALIGTLLHQIFQAGLMREALTEEFLKEYARVVLQKNLESLYACGANESDTHKTLIDAIPKLLNWINSFRDSQDSEAQSVDFGSHDGLKKIKIFEVEDIEEMAWAPKYGLKGMIDASLRVKVESSAQKYYDKIMPLEFKTGKGTTGQTAMEHSAQVMLYTLLMSERYAKNIDRGLLYYLHTDQTQGIFVQRSDLVGLIMRRNELANDLLKASTTQQLPPMLQSPNMCKGCRHLSVCTIYHKAYGGTTEGSGLGNMFDSLVHHLTTAQIGFLRKWEWLIDLEAREVEVARNEIWSSHRLESDHLISLSSLVLDTSEKLLTKNFCKGTRHVYRFVRQGSTLIGSEQRDGVSLNPPSALMKNMDCTLRNGDYVILSTEPGHLLIANGVVVDVGASHITVSFSKRLRLPRSCPASMVEDLHQQVWRIDKDEVLSSFAIMRFNLIQLFLQNDQSCRLRRMIVDLEAPKFDSGCVFSQDPAISYIWSEKTLNDDQRRAIVKILTAKDYALILGMPGTGKTSTMVHAVKALLMRGASILLTSYTNSAVDNLLIKLKNQHVDFIRIGRYEAVHEEVRENCLSVMDTHGVDDIKLRLEQVKVVAVTCLGMTSPLLANKRFDVCIMDEAGQTTLPVALGPLTFASKFVLVGDHYQLPPLVKSIEAKENGMAVSLFCKLSEAHPQAISALQSQYRMCSAIMELSNALIYDNKLRCGSSEIEIAKLEYKSSTSTSAWIKEVLNPERPVIFISTDMLPANEVNHKKAVNNPTEAYIIGEVINELMLRGIQCEDIGVITPYNSQANLIHKVITTSVEIHTIDKYQGRDKDCIVVSFVRSSENPKNCVSSLLGDWHRINVALTRAKKKLIMVGSPRTLSKVPLLKLLIEKVEQQSGILTISKRDINLKMELKGCSNNK